ncbi:MAG: tRNA epoxyqueuosine(34) reductase QueG [Alphaproteobacteria bacterium]
MPPDPTALKDAIRARALDLGFDDVGFTRAELPDGIRRDLAGFLDQGRHGDMDWLAANADRRGDPRTLWPEAVSVVVLGVSYAPHDDPMALATQADRGRVSVYARNRDYHDLIKGRLKRLAGWMCETWGGAVRVFTDTAPVMEKPLAEQGGLGWRGRHTNLVSRRFGSWLLLGEVFTTLAIAPDSPHADRCGSCRRCLDACPTGALTGDPNGDRRIDARRCLSYLTIEHKDHIAEDLRPLMGNHIHGCDDCLAVCPWNRFAVPTADAAFLPRAELSAPRLADLADLDRAAFAEVFRGSPLKRTGRERFVRNVLIAIGNSGRPELAAAARARLDDASPLVRETAAWALERLVASRRDP